MKTIIEYGVSTAEGDINILIKDVNERLKQGYEPFGGIVATSTPDGTVCFAQAMVKYEKPN